MVCTCLTTPPAVFEDMANDPAAHGLQVLGHGACKTVYALHCGKHVLKVNRGDFDGWVGEQTEGEINLFMSVPVGMRKELAEIVTYGEGKTWMVQERLTMGVPAHLTMDEAQTRMQALFARVKQTVGLCNCDLPLHHEPGRNIGFRKGRPVVADYGILPDETGRCPRCGNQVKGVKPKPKAAGALAHDRCPVCAKQINNFLHMKNHLFLRHGHRVTDWFMEVW